jgi:hypothetical protein
VLVTGHAAIQAALAIRTGMPRPARAGATAEDVVLPAIINIRSLIPIL